MQFSVSSFPLSVFHNPAFQLPVELFILLLFGMDLAI